MTNPFSLNYSDDNKKNTFNTGYIPCTRLDPQCRKIHDPGATDLTPLLNGGHGKCMCHSIGNIAPQSLF